MRAHIVLAELLLCWMVFVAVYVFVGVSDNGFNTSSLMQLAWINNVALVAQLVILRSSFGSITAPFVLYALFLSLFTCGQLILYSIGVEPVGADVIHREASRSVGRAVAFYLSAFSLFCAGAVGINEIKRGRGDLRTKSVAPTRDWQDALTAVGAVCVIIGVLPYAVLNVHNLRVVITRGYSGYYEQGARIESPLLGLGYLFITGLVMLACCGRRRLRTASTAMIVLVAGVRLASGDRGEGMIYLLTAYLLVFVFARVSRRHLVWASVVAVFAVIAIPTIGSLRQTYGGDLGSVALGLPANPLTATFGTMGWTLFPLVAVMELSDLGAPAIMGSSYLGGAVGVVPDPLLAGPLLAITQTPMSASPATWLMQQLGLSYGPGFTPFAEAYLNFGWWGGCAALAVFGVIFALLLRFPTSTHGADLLRIALVISIFALIGFSVRGSSNFVIPYLVRYVAVPGIAVVLVVRRLRGTRLKRLRHE